MTDTQAGYMIATPTRRRRFWRKMGFRFHLGNDCQDDTAWKGWMRTNTRMHFGFTDRIRILLSGELRLTHSIDLDVPCPDKTFTRLDWEIRPPFLAD